MGQPAKTGAFGGALRDDAAQLGLIADNVPAMTIAYDETLRCVFANRRFAEFFGLTTATIVGKHLREIIGEAPYEEIKWAFDAVLGGRRATYKRVRTLDNGERRYLEVELTPNLAPDGRCRGLFAVTTDVTERRREEHLRTLSLSVAATLAGSETGAMAIASAIRAICEAEDWACGRYVSIAPDGALRQAGQWGIDDPGVQGFLERTGSSVSRDNPGLTGIVLEAAEPLWIADVSTESRALLAALRPDFIPRGTLAFPVRSEGAIVGAFLFHSPSRRERDETVMGATVALGIQIGQFLERKRAEERLRESEARFRTVVESANDGILVYDRETRIISANSAAERMLGLGRDELIGAYGLSALLPCIREDGSPVVPDDRSPAIAMRTGSPVTGRVLGVRRDQDTTTWMATNTAVLRGGDGSALGAVMTLTDITRLKREEALLRLEQRIARSFDAEEPRSALAGAIEAVCEGEGWEWGRYLEVAGEHLRPFADWCICDPRILAYIEEMRRATYAPGVGLVGTVWQTRTALWVGDAEKDSRVARPKAARAVGARGALIVPVFVLDTVVGVLIFQCRRERSRDQRLLEAMQLLGGRIGQLLRRAKAEEAVRQSEARFRSLCELSSDVFWEQNARFRFSAFNDPSGTHEGSRILGRTPWELRFSNMSEKDWAAHRAKLQAHEPFRDLELCRTTRRGEEVWFSVSGEPFYDAAGAFAGYRGVGRDITARKRDERRIQHLASHDGLTGLPNRTGFSGLLNAARESAHRHGRSLALMFVDLDRFKVINDSLGHVFGDEVLCEAARRLRHTLRASDVVARLGGDEFVVMIPELADAAQAEAAARKVLAALVKPMLVSGRELTVSASLGIALYPQDAKDEQTLMKCADSAMYRAKEAGKNTFTFYSGESERRALERLAMETSLRRALERGEFLLHYQPRVSLATGAVTGVEALARWRHPELGVVPPAEFIPLAEETGAIHDIGRWALETACAQAAQWDAAGLAPVRMAVNVSARQFARDELVGQVRAALAASGLPAGRLELEITESVMAQNLERTGEMLAALRGLGVRLALDDFGTGYSSLSQLKHFQVNTLKIDKAFVADLPQDADDAAIAQAIIGMGRSLRLTVVAEGVEHPEQREFLRRHGCDELQGYLVSPPLEAAECAAFVRRTALLQG